MFTETIAFKINPGMCRMVFNNSNNEILGSSAIDSEPEMNLFQEQLFSTTALSHPTDSNSQLPGENVTTGGRVHIADEKIKKTLSGEDLVEIEQLGPWHKCQKVNDSRLPS